MTGQAAEIQFNASDERTADWPGDTGYFNFMIALPPSGPCVRRYNATRAWRGRLP
jgi:hypothetical protein